LGQISSRGTSRRKKKSSLIFARQKLQEGAASTRSPVPSIPSVPAKPWVAAPRGLRDPANPSCGYSHGSFAELIWRRWKGRGGIGGRNGSLGKVREIRRNPVGSRYLVQPFQTPPRWVPERASEGFRAGRCRSSRGSATRSRRSPPAPGAGRAAPTRGPRPGPPHRRAPRWKGATGLPG